VRNRAAGLFARVAAVLRLVSAMLARGRGK
jgi:hypothetical protein